MTRAGNTARSTSHITQVRCYSLSGGVLAEVSLDCPASFADLRAALREKALDATWRKKPAYQAGENDLHPGKLTWNPKMEVWKMIFLFGWVMLWFHVNFQGVYTSNCETKFRPRKQIKVCVSSLSMEVNWRTGKVWWNQWWKDGTLEG